MFSKIINYFVNYFSKFKEYFIKKKEDNLLIYSPNYSFSQNTSSNITNLSFSSNNIENNLKDIFSYLTPYNSIEYLIEEHERLQKNNEIILKSPYYYKRNIDQIKINLINSNLNSLLGIKANNIDKFKIKTKILELINNQKDISIITSIDNNIFNLYYLRFSIFDKDIIKDNLVEEYSCQIKINKNIIKDEKSNNIIVI